MAETQKNPDQNPTKRKEPVKEPTIKEPMTLDMPGIPDTGDLHSDGKGGIIIAPPAKSP